MSPSPVLPPLRFEHAPQPGLVSCVMPVYNGARYVAEAIDSVLRQTYRPIEIVVVDDGSTDDTPAMLEEFGTRIRAVQQANLGPAEARNRGMAESRGEYLSFLDADDVWTPDKVTLQVEVLEARQTVDLCSCEIRSFWISELRDEAERFGDHPYHRQRPLLSPCTVLARRTLFERIGPFDPALRHGEDTDWFMRMMKVGTVYETLPLLLVHRRQHLSNLTRTHRPGHDGVLELLKRTLDRGRSA